MTNEALPSPEPGERDVPPASEYQRSVKMLFDLLSVPSEPPQTSYYAVTWDSEESVRIQDVTTMTITPTGALGQERRRVSYSAQFNATEVSRTTGEERERFIWCYTGPQRPGKAIHVDTRALAEDYGYRKLTPDNIVQSLTERAPFISIDDYIALIRMMDNRGIPPTPELTADINRLMYQMAHHGFRDIHSPAEAQASRDKMFELIGVCQALGAEISRTVQGYLVSQLLNMIQQQFIKPTPQTTEAAKEAATMLESTIRQGFISDDSPLLHRIFSSSPVYKYPFATELLHDRLLSEGNHGTSTAIFGIGRLKFVRDYIAMVLQRQSGSELHPNIEHFIKNSYFSEYKDSPADRLYDLLNGLLQRVGTPVVIPDDVGSPAASRAGLVGVGRSFATVLSALHGDTQTDFDQKCVEVVEAILAPVLAKRIGKRAVSANEPDKEG